MVVGWLGRARKGLFTREDPANVHKTLGFPCLAHFIFRFAQIGKRDMGFDARGSTLACIALHSLLSGSSMIFRIPQKRILEGSRIWPEYRLHSIIFACRSLACMLLTWVELRFELPVMYPLNAVIVILTCLAADAGSRAVGDNHSSSIRDLSAPPIYHFAASFLQFHATSGCLIGQRRFTLQFMYVWIIQFNAFVMTLRRKNLISHFGMVYGYAAMLGFVYLVSIYEASILGSFAFVNAIGNLAALGRLALGIDKYVLWCGMAVVVHYGRQTVGVTAVPQHAWLGAYWPHAYALTTLAVLVVGYRKVQRKTREREAAAGAGATGAGGKAEAEGADAKHIKAG